MPVPTNFVSRAGWGSTFDYSHNTLMPIPCRGVALHWEGGAQGTFTHDICDNKVRGIERFHVDGRGWAGIAYNALVCPHGYIYEGRGYKLRSAANGDTTVNNRFYAVCYLGGQGDPVTDLAKAAYIRAVQWLRVSGAGDEVVGHRDLIATACPGTEIYTWLKATNFSSGEQPAELVAVWGNPATWHIGSIGPDVTRLGERLVLWAKYLKLPAPYATAPGPEFTETDRAAVEAFQRAQGWTYEDADGFPGLATFAKLESAVPVVLPDVAVIETAIFANLAAYDTEGTGRATRIHRATYEIPEYLNPKQPDWFYFVEADVDMVPILDVKFPNYIRIPQGGKGREAYFRKGLNIKIISAILRQTAHMLDNDTKEYLEIIYTRDGIKCVTEVFHSENQQVGTIQRDQLNDVMKSARIAKDLHGIARGNVLVIGDGNYKGAADYAKSIGWTEAIFEAIKKIDLQYASFNWWRNVLTLGRRIDVAVTYPEAVLLEAEALFGKLIADHWQLRIKRRLVRS